MNHSVPIVRDVTNSVADQEIADLQEMLIRLSRDIVGAPSLEDMLRIVLETLQRFVPIAGGSIGLIDTRRQLYLAAALPEVDEATRRMRIPLGQGIAGRVAQEVVPQYSPDVENDPRLDSIIRNVPLNRVIRSYLALPLIAGGGCIGVLQVDSPDVDALTADHRRLLEAVAVLVSGAVENTRLLEEQREFSKRLQQMYGTANSLLSSFDEDYILREIATRARELFDAKCAAAAELDDRGNIKRFAPDLTEPGSNSAQNSLLAYVAKLKTPIRVDDLAGHPGLQKISPSALQAKSLLAAPLIARGETLGALYITEKLSSQPFTTEEEGMISILAAGAAAALSNARLYDQLRRNIEQLYALHQIGEAIATSLSPEEVFRIFNQDVRRLCGAEACVVSEWNESANRLVSLSENGADELLRLRERPQLYRQLVEAARKATPASFSLNNHHGGDRQAYGYVVPLTVRERVIGLAEMYSHSKGLMAPESASLFVTLSSQLAVGIENSRLYGQLKAREEQLRRFVGRLFQAQEDERRRMSYDVHDGLAQLIVSADIHFSNFASMRSSDPALSESELTKGMNGLRAALTEVRRVVSELRPSTLDDFGLPDTLSRYVQKVAKDEHWEYTFRENLGEMRFDPLIENAVYRIVQEALTNIRKHTSTSRVSVEVSHEDERLRVHVQDWGTGFDLREAREREGHFGLGSMEERARLLGGWCVIESAQGVGTTVKAELPLKPTTPSASVGSS